MLIPFDPQSYISTFVIDSNTQSIRPITPILEEIEFAGLIAEAEKIKDKDSNEN